MSERPQLAHLARRLGVVDAFVDATGVERRTTDRARELLAAALGHPATSEEEAARELARLDAAARATPVARWVAVRRGRRGAASLDLVLPAPTDGVVRWSLSAVRKEGHDPLGGGGLGDAAGRAGGGLGSGTDTGAERDVGASWASPVEGAGVAVVGLEPAAGELASSGTVRLRRGHARIAPRWLGALADGAYELELLLGRDGERVRARQTRVVAPPEPWTAAEALGDDRVFGLLANLYTLRRDGGLGRGDLADLDELVDLAAAHGARFVGLNPLHAQRAVHASASPYTPVSRLFRDPAYLDVAAVPELAATPAVRERLASAELRAELERLRAAPQVDHAAHRRLHTELCTALHRTFRERGSAERRAAYAAYREREGPLLDAFATFLALDEALATPGGPLPRVAWPRDLRRPDAPAVARFAAEHAERVDLFRWLQFELDRQLGAVAARAAERGVDLGLYQDLAVAADREGAESWLFPDLVVQDVSLGAPPDDYARDGQDWGFAPWNPLRMGVDGAELWTRALRAAFRHAGALRIDHALGLVRQFWIPRGCGARDGAYVRFPTDDLLAILALESHRARALVVAEDLGTVPAGFRRRLGREGLLRSSVVYFERGASGAFRPASAYPELALATAGTHDHVPFAGWWTARDAALRQAAGELGANERAAAERARAADRHELVRRLVAEEVLELAVGASPDGAAAAEPAAPRADGGVEVDAGEGAEPRVRVAVHGFLDRTPARLVGVALDDLAGETEPVNLPGITEERHPVWRRRMGRTLAEIAADETARACLAALSSRGGRAPGGPGP